MPTNAAGAQPWCATTLAAALDELETVVSRLAAHDAEGYKAHPWAKLLASIYRAVTRLVPANPDAPDFRLGKSPGPENTTGVVRRSVGRIAPGFSSDSHRYR